MSSPPRVSVLIPAYQHQDFIDEALASVLAQTFGDFEVIVCDDGSRDNTYERALAWEGRDSRVRVVTHPNRENHGVNQTFRRAYAESRGEVIVCLASDDRWHPHRLECQLPLLEASPWAFSRVQFIDVTGAPMDRTLGEDPSTGLAPFLEQMLVRVTIPTAGALFRRTFFEDVGGMGDAPLEDFELFLKMATRHEPGYSDDVVADYRYVPTGLWNAFFSKGSALSAATATIREVRSWTALPSVAAPVLASWERVYASTALAREGEWASAESQLQATDGWRLAAFMPTVWEFLVQTQKPLAVLGWCGQLAAREPEFQPVLAGARRVLQERYGLKGRAASLLAVGPTSRLLAQRHR